MEEATLTEDSDAIVADDKSLATTTEDKAEAKTDETHPDPNGKDEHVEALAETEDPDLKWAKTLGVDPNDPEAVKKLAKIAHDNQREFRTQQQEAKASLNDTATEAVQTGDPSQDRINQLEISISADRFLNGLRRQGLSEPQIDEIDGKMAEVIKQRPYLAMDLDAVYAVATRDSAKKAVQSAKEEGRDEAKAEIARSSASTSPKGNATTGEVVEKDPGLEAFDAEFFK